MSAWPELRESLTVQAGRAPGTVVRCGVMDTALADVPVSVVFFFDRAVDTSVLADGLARALDLAPVFAGRLRTTDEHVLEIVCGDEGVPLAVYDIDESLADAIARVTLPASGYVDHVDAPKARLGGLPLLTVRVTRLAGGAMALGCSWHHAVGDLATFMLLARAWSAAVEGAELPSVELVLDPDAHLDEVLPHNGATRTSFRLPDAEDAARLEREFESALRANRTVQVYFADAEVARMRAEVGAAAGRRFSPNDVLCAHVVSTVRGLDDDHESRHLAMPVNIRRFVGLDTGVMGNLVSEVYLRCPADSTAETLAGEIRAAVDEFPTAHLNLRANQAFLADIGRARLRECIPVGFDPDGRTMTITNWSRFGIYDVSFQGSRPVFFSPTSSLQLPWVAWLVEGFDNTGILCTVVLPARLAGKLRSEAGKAALHRFRRPEDELPPLATTVRKLA